LKKQIAFVDLSHFTTVVITLLYVMHVNMLVIMVGLQSILY